MQSSCEINVTYEEGGYINTACLSPDNAVLVLSEVFEQAGDHVKSVDFVIVSSLAKKESSHRIFRKKSFNPNKFPEALRLALHDRLVLGKPIDPFPKPIYKIVGERDNKERDCLFAYTEGEKNCYFAVMYDNPRYNNCYVEPIE